LTVPSTIATGIGATVFVLMAFRILGLDSSAATNVGAVTSRQTTRMVELEWLRWLDMGTSLRRHALLHTDPNH
jgi:hypothetical protein